MTRHFEGHENKTNGALKLFVQYPNPKRVLSRPRTLSHVSQRRILVAKAMF